MKKILSNIFSLALVLLISACGNSAFATVENRQGSDQTINSIAKESFHFIAPDAVSQGRAFVVTMLSDYPFNGKITWREKIIPFQSKANVNNPQKQSNQKIHSAKFISEVLLAVPIDAKFDLPLKIDATENMQDENPEFTTKSYTASHMIQPKAVSWVTHNLTVDSKYVQPPKEVLNRIEKERQKRAPLFRNLDRAPTWDLPFVRPVKGTISGSFAARRVFNNVPKSPHLGTDMRGAIGTPIYNMADGVVVLAEEHYYSGNAVYVDHGQGVLSMYGHMSKITVKEGDVVKKGDELGKVGATGRVTGPHLHLSLYIQGVAVDAVPFFADQFNERLQIIGGPTPEQPRPPAPK